MLLSIELTNSDRLAFAPNSDMTDELVTSGAAQLQMEALTHVAQLLSSSTGAVEGERSADEDEEEDPLQETDEFEEMASQL